MSETENTIPQNQFKPFATGANAIVQTQEEYEKSIALKEGFRKGLARSNEVNKALRQATSIAAAVAGFTAEKSEQDILDNGDIDTLKQHFEIAIRTISSTLAAEAQGEADALTATFTPILKHLASGKTVLVRAKQKNTSKTPSFQADQTGAKEIVKGNNLPLEEGDIAGAGHWLELQYDEALDKWVLQNPAKGISPLNGVPIGTIEYFAMATPPAGYLKADGAAVGRETYPDLFAAIGTAFGEGDGSTTFNLPDLIDRFAQGSNTPGQKIEAGLPNATGSTGGFYGGAGSNGNGALSSSGSSATVFITNGYSGSSNDRTIQLDLSQANTIYGASDTVQPPALTLLPCIKAFDAATNPGLIDITELAQEMADKTDKMAAANAAMPSDRYVDLTLPVSLSTITAPADGYIFFEKITTAANQYVALYVNAPNSLAIYGANNDLPAANAYPFVLIPVKKGAVVTVEYNAAGTYTIFRFIYANGSVQQ